MQTLIFNTTQKTVNVYKENPAPYEYNGLICTYINVSTVKPIGGCYEVFQVTTEGTVPVFRAPISATNMIIEK
jgi:hypothetical protein